MDIKLTEEDLERIKACLMNNSIYRGLLTLTILQETLSGQLLEREPDIAKQLTTYLNALHVELGELSNELPLKPWKIVKMDKDKVTAEFADILAFLGVIMVLLRELGITPRDLVTAYERKTWINVDRFTGKVPEYRGK